MRMMSKTTECPQCGERASITLFEQVDTARNTEGHRIEFDCPHGHQLSEVDLLRLWAADRLLRRTR